MPASATGSETRRLDPSGASDAEFRVLAEALPHAVWLCQSDGTLDYINQRGLDFFGFSFSELAQTLPAGLLLHPEDRARVLSLWRAALAAGQPTSTEARFLRHDGVFRWNLVRAQPVRSGAGNIIKWVGTSTDVHNVKEANDRSAFLLAVSSELARIRSPEELICTAMARLRERLRAARVTLAEFDEDHTETIVLHQSKRDAHAAAAHPADADESRIEITNASLAPFEGLAAESQRGCMTVVHDTRTDQHSARAYEEWYAPQGVGAIVSAPLLQGDSLVALLSVVEATPRTWTESEVELIKCVADIVWPAFEKARSDRRIAMSEERVRLAQGVAQVGTWDWDAAARVLSFSTGSSELFGFGADEARQHEQWLQHVEEADLLAVYTMLEECGTSGTGEIEYQYRHPERGLRWIYSKAGLVEYAGRRHIVGISLDVTGRRQAEEALKDVNRRKDEFLAMLAHELRNPLAPIRNAAQVLRVHAAGIPQIEWARAVIERQTRHLVRLVDDLLDVSRMVRGQIALQSVPVELAEIVRHAVETSRPLIRKRKHRLTVQLPECSVRLQGDLTRLAQVIANLLNNAAKYTDEGGNIWLEARVEGQQATISVRDTGVGIAPALLPRVFDLFTQAERTLDRAQGGLGIGLTIVKRLVEMHDGSIEARSDGVAKGAEFIVRLPILGQQQFVAPTGARPADATVRAPLRILIVDDNVDAADSIAMLLEMEGHKTLTVNGAQEALVAADTFRPDVVLLDIGLPEMDGYEVARRLRATNAIERMRLVAVTGYGQPADRKRAADAGFDEHLVKPVEPSVLNELLRSLQPRSSPADTGG